MLLFFFPVFSFSITYCDIKCFLVTNELFSQIRFLQYLLSDARLILQSSVSISDYQGLYLICRFNFFSKIIFLDLSEFDIASFIITQNCLYDSVTSRFEHLAVISFMFFIQLSSPMKSSGILVTSYFMRYELLSFSP